MHELPARPEPAPDVDAIDAAYLTRLLRGMGRADDVVAFTREPVGGPSYGGGQLHRFRLTIASHLGHGRPAAPLSLILKESRALGSQALDPAYVRRELDCYRHDLFAGLGARLRVPVAYHTAIHANGDRCWIWMEDFGDAFAVTWTPQALTAAVRDVAELHAHWWDREHDLVRMPFLRHRAQAMYDGLWAARIRANCAAVAGHPDERAIARVFTPERCRVLARLAEAADLVYPHLDRLPQTVLHQDVWLPNLGRCDDRTALIDWSYVGQGTPGAELSQMVSLLIQTWGPDVDDLPFVEALYTGLTRDWGCTISHDEVLAGYELCFCLRPAHALGGPILGGILGGKAPMVGSPALDDRLAAAEGTWRRIERGLRRLDE